MQPGIVVLAFGKMGNREGHRLEVETFHCLCVKIKYKTGWYTSVCTEYQELYINVIYIESIRGLCYRVRELA